MDISNYLRGVKTGVENAAALADDDTKQVASRLATSVESSVQLALIEALSDATTEISAELAPGSVGMSMQGLTPHFTVTLPETPAATTYLEPPSAAEQTDGDDSESTDDDADDTLVRFSLRLPKWAKDKADKRAEAEGVSTNTWLAEQVIREVSRRRRHGGAEFGPPPPPPPFGPSRRGRGPRDGRDGRRGRDEYDATPPPGAGARRGPQFDVGDISAMIDMASHALRDWTGDGRGRGGRRPGSSGGNVQGWV